MEFYVYLPTPGKRLGPMTYTLAQTYRHDGPCIIKRFPDKNPLPWESVWSDDVAANGNGNGVAVEPAKASEPVTPEPEPVTPGVTRTVEAATISEVAQDRTARFDEHLRKFGIALGPTRYAPGTTVVGAGVENFVLSRSKWEAQPATHEALPQIATRVRAEARVDVPVQANTLRMDPDGRMWREGGNGNRLPFEEAALRQLCYRLHDVFPRAADLLLLLETDRRARLFNEQIVRVSDDANVKLRTRLSGDGATRGVFAVVGPSYGVFDADQIADALADPFARIAGEYATNAPRGVALYEPDGSTLRVDALWHANHVVDLAAGDVFKGGIRFRSSDAGGGSVRGDLIVWRNDCLNLIIISRGTVEVLRRVHKGAMEGVTVDLTEATAKAESFIAGFTKDWGILRKTLVKSVKLWGESFGSATDALTWAVGEGKIDGVTARDATVEAMLRAYDEEPGDSLADIVNAVTRYAHRELVPVERQEKIESAAGDMVQSFARWAQA